MSATTYYPGDIVRTRTGKCDAVIERVTPASTAEEIERFAAIRAASPTGSGKRSPNRPGSNVAPIHARHSTVRAARPSSD